MLVQGEDIRMVAKTWIAAAGAWANGVDWSSSGQPGSSDDATITSPAGNAADQVITGPGTARALLLLGNTDLRGAFTLGALTVGGTATPSRLDLDSGSAVVAATVALMDGTIGVSGSATRLTATGALTLGGQRTSYLYEPNTLSVASGAAVQAASIVMALPTFTNQGTTYAAGFDEIDVDAASSLEVGATGGAATGALTVDAGSTLAGAGLVTPARIINQGTITAEDGSLAMSGTITGSGTLAVAAGATLTIHTSTNAVQFLGAGGTLSVDEVATSSLSGGVLSSTLGLGETGVIGGFAPGDLIAYNGGLVPTGITYQPGSGGLGTLTLMSGATILGTLTLAGNYGATTFQVTRGLNAYDIGFAAAGTPTTAPSPGTATPDAYVWTATHGGLWTNAANWRDATTGMSPAAIAPGVLDSVSIDQLDAAPISGAGNAASLTLTGLPVLDGTFSTGALLVEALASATIATGGSMTASTATLADGTLIVSDVGSSLVVNGAITVGGTTTLTAPASSLSAVYGGAIRAQSVTLAPSFETGLGGGTSPAGAESLAVDQDSTFEVGTATNLPAGTLAVDAGNAITGLGTISAPSIANQGTIAAEGGTLLLAGTVIGTGTLQIGAGATLVLQSSTAPVTFADAGGTLQVGSTTAPALVNGTLATVTTLGEQGSINGFAPGDTIDVTPSAGSPVPTSAVYRATSGSGGTLTLMNGSSSVGTLTLEGQYTADRFQVTAANGGVDITVAPAFTSPDPLFDVAYYLAENPDVAAAGVDPYQHYMTTGWKEGRNPSPYFDTDYYLNQNPDVVAAGINPLTHFEQFGWKEGRDPSLAFSDSQYLAHNPDVAAAGVDPLLHYVENGQYEGRATYAATPHATGPQDPLVDAAYVYAHNPDVAAQGLDASAWYNSVGWKQGANPDADFDTNYYLTQNPDVAAAGVDPLTHFETFGWKEGRQPSLLFDDAKYLAAYPDVAAAGVDPLVHYEQNGQFEGRMTFLTGGSAAPDPLVNAAYYDAQLGATLIPGGAAGQAQAAASYDTSGWQRGLNPDAFFDTAYYLQQNPDVAAAHVDPLLHYETYGWHEGRNPSPGFDTDKYLAAYPDVAAAGVDPLLHYVQNGIGEGRAAFAV